MNLKTLDITHPLRNTPLVDIGAYYKSRFSDVWVEVRPAYSIAKKSYNDLQGIWLKDEWKATKFSEDWETMARQMAVAQNGNVGYD
jgi:hypothetical protein